MITRHDHRTAREGGYVLLIGLFLVLLVGGLAVGLLEEGNAAKRYLSLHEDNLKALEIAEAGLIRAEMEIRPQVDHGGDGIGNVVGVIDGGTFEVTVHDDPVSLDRWILRSRGDHGYAVRRIEIGVRRRVDRRFVEGLFAKDEMLLGGELTTDKYDSDLGDWASQAVNSDAGGAYAQSGGHVGSNADITVTGTSAYIRGNAIPGPFRETVLTGGAVVTGDMAPRIDLIDIQPEPYEQYAAAFASSDNEALFASASGNTIRYKSNDMSLTLNAQAILHLPAGTYCFSDLTLNGGSKIIVDGPVHVYVTGTMDLTGGGLVNAGPPGNFTVHAHPYALPGPVAPTATAVKVNGGTQVGMTLFAPEADLVVSGGDHLFGAAVAKTIDMGGNVQFHYDAALGRIGIDGIAHLERLYWRDLAPPRR